MQRTGRPPLRNNARASQDPNFRRHAVQRLVRSRQTRLSQARAGPPPSPTEESRSTWTRGVAAAPAVRAERLVQLCGAPDGANDEVGRAEPKLSEGRHLPGPP